MLIVSSMQALLHVLAPGYEAISMSPLDQGLSGEGEGMQGAGALGGREGGFLTQRCTCAGCEGAGT